MSVDELTAALAPFFAGINARLDQLEKQLTPGVQDQKAAVNVVTVARQPNGADALKALARTQMKGERKRGN